MSSLKAAFYLWKAYQYYWIGSSGLQYYQTVRQCYLMTHPTIRWCYQKIYQKNPEGWSQEVRLKEYRLLAELEALRDEHNSGNLGVEVIESEESRESGESRESESSESGVEKGEDKWVII